VYLSALASYDSLKNGDPVREAELQVMLDETRLTKAQIELENAALVAPYDGVTLEVKARAGETVAAGSGVILLSNPSALEVQSTVIEEDLPLVQPGQTVELYFDARSDAVVKGRVARIVPQRVSGDRPLYPVAIALDKIPTGLAPGMSADASIVVARCTDVLRLPRALVRARSDSTAQVQVWLGDHAEVRTVKIGLRGDQYVEILEGLREGDLVVGK
jgi:HlyD family secretion protein